MSLLRLNTLKTVLVSSCMIILVTGITTTLLPDLVYFTRMLIINSSNDDDENEVKDISKEINTTSIALPFGIDRNLHMNNARHLYEINFSRRYLFNRLGLWKILKENELNCLVVGQTIRYRKEILIFELFNIKSKILDWDDDTNSIYIETKFLNKKDNFVIAIHHCKYKLVGNNSKKKNSMTPTNLLIAANLIPKNYQKTERNSFIKYWDMANDISSSELNPNKKKTKPLNINRRIFDSNDDLLSLSGLTPVKTVLTPVKLEN